MEALSRLASSKAWHYFWLVFSVVFMVLDFMTGSFVFAAVMLLLAVFWGYQLNTIYKGTNYAYNKYHGKETV